MFRVQGFRGLGVCDLGLARYSKKNGVLEFRVWGVGLGLTIWGLEFEIRRLSMEGLGLQDSGARDSVSGLYPDPKPWGLGMIRYGTTRKAKGLMDSGLRGISGLGFRVFGGLRFRV